MTTPVPPQAPPQGQQPPPRQQDGALDDTALAVAIAALLAQLTVAGAYAASVAGMLAVLKLRFRLSSGALKALGAVLTMVTKHPRPATGVTGAASAQVSRMNAARRAQYVVAATKRIQAAVAEARAKGVPEDEAFAAALATEQRYYELHLDAIASRAYAA